ncbi:MAG: hypothetical protein HQL78_00335 [Magnetococcales bacterium]|nr:hypothetical protein [Magnetococcales bacterium]MBF0418596.1 hypothetical protein [Magnetococcales bacterium]
MALQCVYLTGATESYFLLTLPLLESFAQHAKPGEILYVCDFGLSESQKKYLELKGQLLPRPPALAPGLHPYRYKASMNLFAQNHGLQYESVVWIDSDCLVVGPLTQAIHHVIDSYGDNRDFLAICQDMGGSIADIIQTLPVAPFVEMLERTSISRDNPYLNCAVFILRSPKTFKDWQERAMDIKEHPLFEQNILNVLAYEDLKELHLLDRDVWNVHDLDLDRLQVHQDQSPEDVTVTLNNKEVLVVHATSYAGRTVAFRPIQLPVTQGYVIQGLIRLVNNPPIRNLFLTATTWYLVKNKKDLIDSGVAVRIASG